MSGDYTRFTHRPERNFSSVLMQQGRVLLACTSAATHLIGSVLTTIAGIGTVLWARA